jgi:DnaJ domain
MADTPDYYALLDVPPDADEATIRLAYRRLARLYHPDVAGSGSLERMQRLNVAYRTLSDPERRRTYDLSRPVAPARQRPTHVTAAPQPPPRPQPIPSRPIPPGSTTVDIAGPLRFVTKLYTPDVTPVAALALWVAGQHVAVGLLDGRVRLWDVSTTRLVSTLSFAAASSAGVLQEVRFSPSGAYVAAWGLHLGLRVWQAATGAPVWAAGINSPSGMMDLALADDPPFVRLALPDAPVALAEDDPFRWAHEGRYGTDLFARPLAGPVDPAASVPLVCRETAPGSRAAESWRVQARLLAPGGHALLTCSAVKSGRAPEARILRLWDLDHRTLLGAAQPRPVAQVAQPLDALRFPLTVTPSLSWVAASFQGVNMRLCDVRTRRVRDLATGPVPEDARVALAPDAGSLAIARGAGLDLWDTRSNRCVQRWTFTSEITVVAFAPEVAKSSMLAVGTREGAVEIWGLSH